MAFLRMAWNAGESSPFYPPTTPTGLWWSTLLNNWTDTQMTQVGQSDGEPALAVSLNQLYIAWRGGGYWEGAPSQTLYWSRYDGVLDEWTPPQAGPGESSQGPALADYNGTLYMAWRGPVPEVGPFPPGGPGFGDQRLYWSSFASSNWSALQPGPGSSSSSPALASFDDGSGLKLYMTWKGEGADQRLWWSSFNGSNWSPQQTGPGSSSNRPALTSFDDGSELKLYMVWKGEGADQRLWWSSFNGTKWSPQQTIPKAESDEGPALASFGDTLYVAWRGSNADPRLYWLSFASGNWSSPQIGPGSSFGGPALAVW